MRCLWHPCRLHTVSQDVHEHLMDIMEVSSLCPKPKQQKEVDNCEGYYFVHSTATDNYSIMARLLRGCLFQLDSISLILPFIPITPVIIKSCIRQVLYISIPRHLAHHYLPFRYYRFFYVSMYGLKTLTLSHEEGIKRILMLGGQQQSKP